MAKPKISERNGYTTDGALIAHWVESTARFAGDIRTAGTADPTHRKHVLKNRGGVYKGGFSTPRGMASFTVKLGNRIGGDVWDQCTINGEQVGNRCGAAKTLAAIISRELAELLAVPS